MKGVAGGGDRVWPGELLLELEYRCEMMANGPISKSLSSEGGVDIATEASCNSSAKIMLRGKWAVKI